MVYKYTPLAIAWAPSLANPMTPSLSMGGAGGGRECVYGIHRGRGGGRERDSYYMCERDTPETHHRAQFQRFKV
jgi:hypothetical protein